VRIITLNANGIRSAAAKGAFVWLRQQDADVVCIQETKAQEPQLEGHDIEIPGYHRYFFDAQRPGYSGTALYCRRKPTEIIRGFGVEEFDGEGRYLEARFGKLAVVSLYLPSGSSGPERQASKFRFLEAFMPHLKRLRRRRSEYILCGDWNIAHKEIEWWSNRGQAWAKNVGWRIDYHVVSKGLAGAARSAHIHKSSRFSDHAPLIIDYDLRA